MKNVFKIAINSPYKPKTKTFDAKMKKHFHIPFTSFIKCCLVPFTSSEIKNLSPLKFDIKIGRRL